MTPREYLLAHVPALSAPRSPLWECDPPPPAEDEAATLGLRALAACVASVESRGATLPGIDAEHAAADDARCALPAVLRAALDALADCESDARAAHRASGHGHRYVAALHRTAAESCQALAFELHAAARLAGVPIAAPKDNAR